MTHIAITDSEEFERECEAGNLTRIQASSIDKTWLGRGLVMSCKSHNLDLVKYLLDEMTKVYDLSQKDNIDMWSTVFIMACKEEFPEVLPLIMKYKPGLEDVLSYGCSTGNKLIINATKEYGAKFCVCGSKVEEH